MLLRFIFDIFNDESLLLTTVSTLIESRVSKGIDNGDILIHVAIALMNPKNVG